MVSGVFSMVVRMAKVISRRPVSAWSDHFPRIFAGIFSGFFRVSLDATGVD